MSTVLTSTISSRPWRAELRACFALSWPLMLTNAIEMAMNITSVAMIGRIGPEALAASTLGLALYTVVLLFGVGVTASVSALVARDVTRSRSEAGARRIVQQGLWGAAVLAALFSVLLWNSAPLFRAAGQDERLLVEAAAYLRWLEWALWPALVYLVLRSLFAALEQPRWTVATGVAAVMLNAVLNWVFIGGNLGAPPLGLAGSGLATSLSNLFMASTLAFIAAAHPRFRHLQLFRGLLRPGLAGFGAFWRLGLPIGISVLLETGMFGAAAAFVGRFGAVPLAAHAIAIQVASFMFMVPLGISQAATIRVARALGAGDRAAVARAGWTALALGEAAMLLSASILIGMPRPVIGLFIGRAEPGVDAVTELAVTLLSIAGLFQIADGAQVVLSGMLRGLHQTRAAMVIAAIGYWGIGLPFGYLLAFPLGFHAAGVWMGLTAGLFAAAGLLAARWLQHMRTHRARLA